MEYILARSRQNRNFRSYPEPEPEVSVTKMSGKVAGMFMQNFTRIGTQLITPEKAMWRRGGGEEGRRWRRRSDS